MPKLSNMELGLLELQQDVRSLRAWATRTVSTTVVGGYSMYIITECSYLPRELGVPLAEGLMVMLLSFWWLYFISPEV